MSAGRPRTPIGTWGTIHVRRVPSGAWEARTRYRDSDGRLRLVSARGRTAGAARNRLQTRLADRSEATTADSGITARTTVADLCAHWLDHKTGVRPQTIGDYRQTISSAITPQIGGIELGELRPGRVAAFLDRLPPATSRRARAILSQALALAVAHDAIGTNPIAGLPKARTPRPEVKVLDLEELVDLRTGVEDWAAGRIDDDGRPVTRLDGRSVGRGHNLLAFVDLLLATGCRPGELAAARWCDVDLTTEPPTLLIDATMVYISGAGLQRQPQTKTGEARSLALPPFAVQVLAEMRAAQHTPIGAAPVFPTDTGGFRDPGNIRRQWRRARRAAGRGTPDRFAGVDFRMMRRTVATLIDRAVGDEDAAAQLGHASVAMTRRHYIAARAAQAPDLTAILQTLATG
ncbi:site-specific integrase [Corynebacterium sphenisci]|uniref:site-specific integrase n=1 Tax=Corynebacterium sphenisci TaxID=191493 RepID=UPI0026E0149E|nr:tyrosine-type recombinase/integrase [Corynebacterium sphenisci]MDO5730824.1 tyrosine-type recombinase/integrase [Corynebacterium sphenisci]